MYLEFGGRTLGGSLHRADSINYFLNDAYISLFKGFVDKRA